MASVLAYREAVRVKVKKYEGHQPPEWRKFSVDPQITSLEVLYSILMKAFDLKADFGISYKTIDSCNVEIYVPVLSEFDLEAAFVKAHNLSILTRLEPCLNLRVDIKPFSDCPQWETPSGSSQGALQQSFGAGQRYVQTVQNRLPGLIMNQMEKTFSLVQRALNLVEDPMSSQPLRPPLSDSEFRACLDSVGQIVESNQLRKIIYAGGIDPSLRRVVWKHILNVYPDGMTGLERMDYIKRKTSEYCRLRDTWRSAVQRGNVAGELAYVTSMVRKDVLRTDRLHPFYAGSDDNQNIAALFNILTTYALNHPIVSYCQGMSDIASPLLVTMADEAQAYICFCAIMQRLAANFMLDGVSMTRKFSHLADALQHYDPEFYAYLQHQQADDLLFCYRWLLLEMKREFAFDDALRMLEVLWSSLPPAPPVTDLALFEKEFEPQETPPPATIPSIAVRTPRENAYTKFCALRRQSSAQSLSAMNGCASIPFSNCAAQRLNATKRMNQSLDENLTRNLTRVGSRVQHSLDDSKLEKKEEPPELSADDLKVPLPPRPRSVSPNEVALDQRKLLRNETGHGTGDKHKTLSKLKNKALFSYSTGNLISRQLIAGKSGGHFKDLKEKIAASKKDKTDTETEGAKSSKVVKNFNEFLNFSSINKNRIAEKRTNNKKSILPSTDEFGAACEAPSIKLTCSSLDFGSESPGYAETNPFLAHIGVGEKPMSFDGSSPDDSQDYFPMTTSMTRELRLELENLDRQVFGTDFHTKQFNEAFGESTTKTCRRPFNDEISYTHLAQDSVETVGEEDEVPDGEIRPCPSTRNLLSNGFRRVHSQEREDNAYKRISTSSANNDVFVWENPLHQRSPGAPCDDGEQEALQSQQCTHLYSSTTPDEQADLEYDGEIIEETLLGQKTVTPIRLVRKNGELARHKSKFVASRNSMSMPCDFESPNTPPAELTTSVNGRVSPIILNPTNPFATMTNSCEEASEVNIALAKLSGSGLPTPINFGGGNPFLMFLCLTLLLQHRDFLMKNEMDYNEMAMHFDKMVRKHNVNRVLNQARRMYAEYRKSQAQKTKAEST